MKEKRIIFTVTNDLSFDQRMQRICSSLACNGWHVTLVGRSLKKSLPLYNTSYLQKRLYCIFTKGPFFYAEYNIRLFFYLLFQQASLLCAVDLDTIIPCLFISKIKGSRRVYDAHELFTEMKEVKNNAFSKKIWTFIERTTVPGFQYGYTVCDSIAHELYTRYGVQYKTIRNISSEKKIVDKNVRKPRIIYAGAVNEGRGFEVLIRAMKKVNYPLVIYGDGNYMQQLKTLIREHGVADKVTLKGMVLPSVLWEAICEAKIGVGLYEKNDLNQYWALPNKFFDYIQAMTPQVTMNYPEFKKVNDDYNIALLINELHADELTAALNLLMENSVLYNELQENCTKARQYLTWENEQNKLFSFYNSLI